MTNFSDIESKIIESENKKKKIKQITSYQNQH